MSEAAIVGAIGSVLATLISSFILRAVNKTGDRLGDIERHLSQLNGRVGKAETWQVEHEKRDDERFEQVAYRLERLEDK